MSSYDEDSATPPPPMPAKIAVAILKVMKHMAGITLAKDETNEHENFKYVSVDGIYAETAKACVEAGLIVNLMQVGEEREQVVTGSKTYNVVNYYYTPMLIHESGETWVHYGDKRAVRILWRGATTSGAAHSYGMKQYLRGLAQIATGEKDADAEQQLPPFDDSYAPTRAATDKRKAEGKPATSKLVPLLFGDHKKSVPLDEVIDAASTYLTGADKGSRATWRAKNADGLEVLHKLDKQTWLALGRIIENGITI